MAQCKKCSISGWFLSVSDYGMCAKCTTIAGVELPRLVQIIQESVAIIEKSKKLETILSRADVISEKLSVLETYQSKGIHIVEPSAFAELSKIRENRDGLVHDFCLKELQVVHAKAPTSTHKSMISALSKLIARIHTLKVHLRDPEALAPVENKAVSIMNHVQYEAFLEAAKKYEFKNQPKKALDQYYEALYFLRSDSVPDGQQRAQISFLESKIVFLGGEVK